MDAYAGVLDGTVRGFVGLGGNFLRAVPDSTRLEPAWARLQLTVHVATRLNRSHLVPGEAAFLLPCLGRIEIDRQASGEQLLSVEDSTGHIHASRGVAEPADATQLSEAAIVAGIAQATLEPNARVPWADWVGNQALVRDAIEATGPEVFKDFNQRLGTPAVFRGRTPRAIASGTPRPARPPSSLPWIDSAWQRPWEGCAHLKIVAPPAHRK